MAFVIIDTRKTQVTGKYNIMQFDTLMAQKGYMFLLTCSTELIDNMKGYFDEYNFSIDMDFFYKSKTTLECQYLIIPGVGFSFELFLKFCCTYVDPESYRYSNN